MGTDEKEMNMKNEPFLRLHCPLLESLLLKVKEMLACRVCLVVEMVMAVVGMLPECGICLLWQDCPHDPLQRQRNAPPILCKIRINVVTLQPRTVVTEPMRFCHRFLIAESRQTFYYQYFNPFSHEEVIYSSHAPPHVFVGG